MLYNFIEFSFYMLKRKSRQTSDWEESNFFLFLISKVTFLPLFGNIFLLKEFFFKREERKGRVKHQFESKTITGDLDHNPRPYWELNRQHTQEEAQSMETPAKGYLGTPNDWAPSDSHFPVGHQVIPKHECSRFPTLWWGNQRGIDLLFCSHFHPDPLNISPIKELKASFYISD